MGTRSPVFNSSASMLLLSALAALATTPARAIEVGPALDVSPTIHGDTSAALVLPDGDVLVGGSFDLAGGLRRDGLARLDTNGVARPAFDADCRARVVDGVEQRCGIGGLLLTPDGALLITGSFAGFGSIVHTGIAKLSATTGAIDEAWGRGGPAGTLVAAIGNQLLLRVDGGRKIISLSLSGDGTTTAGFIPITDIEPATPVTHNGRDAIFYVRGAGGHQRVVRADLASGTTDTNWTTREFGKITALAFLPTSDHLVIADSDPWLQGLLSTELVLVRVRSMDDGAESANWGGRFPGLAPLERLVVGPTHVYAAVGGFLRHNDIERFALANGARDTQYLGWPNQGRLELLDVDREGRALAATTVAFDSDLGLPEGSTLQRLRTNGDFDHEFRARIRSDGTITHIATAPAAGSIVHGDFTFSNEAYVNHLIRVRPDGVFDLPWQSADLIWSDGLGNQTLSAMATSATQDAFIATTRFTDSDLYPPRVHKLDAAGHVDVAWHSDTAFIAEDEPKHFRTHIGVLLADPAEGWLYVGGRFEGEVCGEYRRNLVRVTLAAPCRADPDWNPDPDDSVLSLALDPARRVYVGGEFQQIGGAPHTALARIEEGTADPLWTPLTPIVGQYRVRELATYADRVFAIYDVIPLGGSGVAGVMRVGADDGVVDASWRPQPATAVKAMAITRSGRLVLARSRLTGVGVSGDFVEDYDPLGSASPRAVIPLARGDTVNALAPGREDDALLIGGRFRRLLGEERIAIAEVLLESRALFSDGFD